MLSEPTGDWKDGRGKSMAVILAAGRGRRLLPLTVDIQKCLLEVGGFPILYHQLNALEKNDIRDVVLVVGFEAEKIREYVRLRFPELHVVFVYNPHFRETDTLYSLALAVEGVNFEGTVFQMNGDVIFEPGIVASLKNTSEDISYIGTKAVPCREEEMKVLLTEDKLISALNKQCDPAYAAGEAVGINKFSPDFWRKLSHNLQILKNGSRHEYFEYAVEKTLANGARLFPFYIGHRAAMEVDFPEDLETARREFKNLR